MPEENKDTGEGTPTSAPEGTTPKAQDKPEGQPPETPPEGGQPPEAPETPEGQPEGPKPGLDNQATELKKQLDDFKGQLEESRGQLTKAETAIQKERAKSKKYRDRLDEHGLLEEDEREEEGQLSAEQVDKMFEDKLKPIVDGFNKITVTVDEFLRSQGAKKDATKPGGGEGGQKPPLPPKEPALSVEDQRILKSANLHYDPKRGGYVGPSGKRVWKIEEIRGVELPKAQQ